MALEAAWCTANGVRHVPAFADMHGVDRARNKAVEIADESGADYLLMQDADCFYRHLQGVGRGGFAIESLMIAIEEHDSAAAALVFPVRNGQHLNVEPLRPNTTCVAEKIGAGVLLLDMRRLKNVPRPFFRYVWNDDGSMVGEDIYFCRHIQRHGLSIAADCTMVTFHSSEEAHPFDPREAYARLTNGGKDHGESAGR
jgi:hypothetical protein